MKFLQDVTCQCSNSVPALLPVLHLARWGCRGCNSSSCRLLPYFPCAAVRCWKSKWWSLVVALLDFPLLARLWTEDEGSSLCACMKLDGRDMVAECGLTGFTTPKPEVGISATASLMHACVRARACVCVWYCFNSVRGILIILIILIMLW